MKSQTINEWSLKICSLHYILNIMQKLCFGWKKREKIYFVSIIVNLKNLIGWLKKQTKYPRKKQIIWLDKYRAWEWDSMDSECTLALPGQLTWTLLRSIKSELPSLKLQHWFFFFKFPRLYQLAVRIKNLWT